MISRYPMIALKKKKSKDKTSRNDKPKIQNSYFGGEE